MKMSRVGVAIAVMVAASVPALAQVQNGSYQFGACIADPGEGVLQVENNVLRFYESLCTLADPVPIQGANGFSYVGNCAGEGEEWQGNIMLIPMEGGMRLINDGTIVDYTRCDG